MICNLKTLSGLRNGVFLDTARPGADERQSFLFADPRRVIRADTLNEVDGALSEIDRAAKRYWLAGWISYEAGSAWIGAGKKPASKLERPLIWMGVYDQPQVVDHFDPSGLYVPAIDLDHKMTFAEYARNIDHIKCYLAEGQSYQVNYTYDVDVRAECSPPFLYAALRQSQPTPFSAFIQTDELAVLSFSPELFFRRREAGIEVKPMKGTAPFSGKPAADKKRENALRSDPKTRAENLMIVDLLRNDLGKIARPGGVHVRSLFDIEQHPTLLQMTSAVTAQIDEPISYREIFHALFPSGSVTGAPKQRTMQIIAGLEQGVRGVYCGAIGYISPKRKAVFNVPIRTLQQGKGELCWQYRVGGGIVWDSTAEGEWQECRTKTAFLTSGAVPEFELIETVLWNGKDLDFAEDHIRRMTASARVFQWPLKREIISLEFQKAADQLNERRPCVVRFLVDASGTIRHEILSLQLKKGSAGRDVSLSGVPLDSENLFLQHKTSYRPWYSEAYQKISADDDLFDVLFFNQRNQLCEGARSNVFVRLSGKIYTPPRTCGLLPGILRSRMLKQGKCRERILTRDDLLLADEVFCGNSVRGLLPVRIRK
ncbi:MAG: aminodeoxychorismate synthase component I [Candidatus Omnitrophota bacterium]